jgi:hypothetical protein
MNKYGPNSPQVELFIERLKVVTAEEVKKLIERLAVRNTAWNTARNTAWDATWNTTRDAAWNTTRAAQAIVVMDLITEEQFQILTEPFAEILVELGIAWEGK